MAKSTSSRDLLQRHFEALQADITAIVAKSAPLREKRDALVAEMQPLEVEARELTQQLNALERPQLAVLKMELATIARALGGKRMSDGAPTSDDNS